MFFLNIFDICLGHQLLSLAAGFTRAKMKYGSRSHNQPCTLYGTKICYITCHNHGYAADINSNSEASVNWET
jgi:carbamoylphosphate synthase small subunit